MPGAEPDSGLDVRTQDQDLSWNQESEASWMSHPGTLRYTFLTGTSAVTRGCGVKVFVSGAGAVRKHLKCSAEAD